MGLDTVELVLSFEDEFGIHINDTVAAECTTPEHVATYVYSRVRKNRNDACLSQKGFYKIRESIVNAFNIDKEKITPNTNLHEIIGNNIKANWPLLQQALGTEDLPLLKRSKSFLIITSFILPALIVTPLVTKPLSIEILFICYTVLSIAINIFTRKMGNVIPREHKTVSSLIPFVECSKTTIWSKELILQRIIEITSEQLGIPAEEIHRDSHFVHDLGAD